MNELFPIQPKYVLRDYQQAASDAAVAFFNNKRSAHRGGVIIAGTGCHAKGSGILMYDGTIKKVEDIQVGDVVMGNDGTPRNVLCLHHGTDKMFRIKPIKGKPFVVNGGHILHLYRRNEKYSWFENIRVNQYVGMSTRYRNHSWLFREFEKERVPFVIDSVGIGEYYGFTLDGNNLYCDEQFFVHHNSGKSLIIADIARRLDGNIIVFQPSKEILEQNYEKLRSFGADCSIWSASMNKKVKSRITFATIGSVKNCKEIFDEYKYVIADECHLISAKSGMYKEFIERTDRKVLGLTGTPYRLTSTLDSAMLKFITRTRPRIFSTVLHVTQTSEMVKHGYLAKLRYFDMQMIDASHVRRNSTGMDYDDTSLKQAYQTQDLNGKLFHTVLRLLHPKNGVPRKGILVFTRYIDESEYLVQRLKEHGVKAEVVTSETKKKERESVIQRFKKGEIQVVSQVNCLGTGFDFPALDTIVMARPTMSLAIWVQAVGRAIRGYEGKDGWVVDLCGNYAKFGRTDDIWIGYDPSANGYAAFGVVKNECGVFERKQLTNVLL